MFMNVQVYIYKTWRIQSASKPVHKGDSPQVARVNLNGESQPSIFELIRISIGFSSW